jgi:large subunit ribosomal protein L21
MNEFVIFKTGGKQYKVSVGTVLSVEKIADELQPGQAVSFDTVLMKTVGEKTEVGFPHLNGAKVEAEVIEAMRAKKVLVVKYKAKSRYLKKNGHRQPLTKIRITKI